MNGAEERRRAPRSRTAGALWHGATLLLAVTAGTRPAAAQTPPDTVPPRPDTVAPADTVPSPPAADTLPADTAGAVPGAPSPDTVPPDTVGTPAADTLAADTSAAAPDTLAADSLPPPENLPALPPGLPAHDGTGVWEWDREALLANRAVTLTQLLEQIPGVVALRGGDFGTPRTVTALGTAGGGVRVFRDGVEMLPLEGSVPDLARVGLGSLERVRVFRTAAGIRIELETVRPKDSRPYSLIEAGTGDLDTNLFRGAFTHPRALGGNVALSLDRLDTSGRAREEPGSISSVWLRYSYLHGDRFGVVAEFDRSSEDRDTLYTPSEATRTDWALRGRVRLLDGVVADAFWNSSALKVDTAAQEYEPFPFRAESRSQVGGRLSAARGPFFGRASVRRFSGEGLADGRLSAEAGVADADVGGVAGEWSRESWPERSASRTLLRAWTAPFWGASVFGSVEAYTRAVPYLPPRPPEPDDDGAGDGAQEPTDGAAGAPASPGAFFTEGTGARFGARFGWRGLELMGARLLADADGLHPFGLPMDRTGFSLPAGGERRGWETAFRVPLLLDGLSLVGSGQLWESEATPASVKAPVPARPYLPRRTWKAALSYHDTFYPTGNLEIWTDVGVVGRDRMRVPVRPPPDDDGDASAPGPITRPADAAAVVPFYQSWYARLQIRVVTVRIFISWENFTVREANQDFPGRLLPSTRTMYGVRWTLWN